MNADLTKLIEVALKLPPEARAALASRLLESIHDDQADPDAETAWEAEITRRLEELDEGKVKTIPWSEARRQILRAQ